MGIKDGTEQIDALHIALCGIGIGHRHIGEAGRTAPLLVAPQLHLFHLDGLQALPGQRRQHLRLFGHKTPVEGDLLACALFAVGRGDEAVVRGNAGLARGAAFVPLIQKGEADFPVPAVAADQQAAVLCVRFRLGILEESLVQPDMSAFMLCTLPA